MMGKRLAGILLHPTSLPHPATLGEPAIRFLDLLAAAGARAWQMLPVCPPGPYDSPYAGRSAFAGDDRLIDLHWLVERGWLTADEAVLPPVGRPHRVDFAALRQARWPRLQRAYQRFRASSSNDQLQAFVQEQPWASEFALFETLHRVTGRPWWEWPPEYRDLPPPAPIPSAGLDDAIHFNLFLQYVFDAQWREFRAAARERNIVLIGDMPIFVDRDSADHWTRRHLFLLDANGNPSVVAGVPPDAFSETGQRWGNPLYDWDAMRADGYRWWIDRFRRALALFDAVRVDHFRGFVAAWHIPAHEPTAVRGSWFPGPGRDLFDALQRELGTLPIIVEDLGIITDDVRALRDELGYPGMAVLQFAFGGDPDNPYLPRNHRRNQVVYTGTHDNDTTLGWWQHLPEWERDNVRRELGIDGSHIVDDLISTALHSIAETAIVPMQDLLALDSEHRMNHPGRAEGNWTWRFAWEQVQPDRLAWFHDLAAETARLSDG
ncbi:4-alpha-glucanotransferase [Tepidiforma sp.]|uniref:4-alpha-glucanotransferase n=1 Tax=Tepidiforma sp. TaxID=2682230 RepID=UPI002ADE5924|nr:4-alpha-glucanotransferase [Tepidiforma sp.]